MSNGNVRDNEVASQQGNIMGFFFFVSFNLFLACIFQKVRQTFFACTFCFPNTDHMMILRRFDPLSCSLNIVHADIFMFACTLFNEQDKGSNLRVSSHDLYGKTKCTSEKGLLHLRSLFSE